MLRWTLCPLDFGATPCFLFEERAEEEVWASQAAPSTPKLIWLGRGAGFGGLARPLVRVSLSLPRAAVEIKTQVHTGLRAQIGQRSVWQTRGNSITLFRPRFRCFLIQNASMGVGKRI